MVQGDRLKNITIITAFFDIGRDDFTAIPRSNETYMNNFKFWARIKNNLVIYTDKKSANEILSIRNQFGLAAKTKIILIDNIDRIEPDILNRMCEVSNDEYFINFRYITNATSNIAKYSYLMLLKSWFMADAVKRELASGMVAWIDFGFNHGGELYTNPEEFAFEWKYNFTDKIHLFYYKELDNKPIFEIVRRLNDSIMGCLIVLPSSLCSTLWNLNRQAMITLNKVGLSDDDQLILLMSYRENPELFEINESEWFLPLKTFGGKSLNIREKKNYSYIKNIIRIYLGRCIWYFKKRVLAARYAIKTYCNLIDK